jgi:type II secretory pathway component GspD/PulD (secretin)
MKKITWACAVGALMLAAGAWVLLTQPLGSPRAAFAAEDAQAETQDNAASPDENAAPDISAVSAESEAAMQPKAAKSASAGVRVTLIRSELHAGKPYVKIITQGKVRYMSQALAKPDRFLIKLSGAVLAWKPATLAVNQEFLQKIRAAQHGSEVWVVLDLEQAQTWKVTPEPTGLSVAPAGAAAIEKNAAPVPVRQARATAADSTAVEVEPVKASDATAAETAAYKVVDVSVEDTGEKTRVVVTTDGPVRYRVEREKRNEFLNLWIHGAALSWNGKLSGLPKGAVRRINAYAEEQAGEPLVRLALQMVQAVPFVVLKDQNQVVLELNNPNVIAENLPNRGNLNTRVSVDFQNADFVSVLRALAQDAGFDLVVSPGAQDLSGAQSQVTVTVNDQPFETVLDMLLKPRKLAFALGGNTLRIGLASEFSPETRVFALKNVDVKNTNLKETLEAGLTEGSRSKIIVDGQANRVIVTAIPSDLIKCESVLARLDAPSHLLTRTFTLNYAEVAKLAPLVKPMLSGNASLNVNDRENALVITDIPGNMLRVSSLIRSLDKKSKQVMIEAKIVEVSVSNEQDLGIRWTSSMNDPSSNPNISAASNPAAIKSVGTLSVGLLQGGVDISATLAVLEAKGTANTISNPRIATLDNQVASLSASQNIPYNTSVVSNGVVKAGVEYLELPIILTVTPHISKNNQVLLSPTVLKVTTVVNPGNPPETATRTATTQMMVGDGETVAIGGMVRDIEISKESKIPLLGDIPLLGYLFKSTVVTKDKVELVVFLTPHVLD